MKIAIIGAGNVGGTLGRRWADTHQVTYGLRDPGRAPEGVQPANFASIPEAVRNSEVVVFAVPYGGLKEAALSAGDLTAKVLVDCTNPINADFSGLLTLPSSAAEELAQLTGSPRVVKSFNTVGNNIMANPAFGSEAATMLYCGDDAESKKTVDQLAADLGFQPVDAGPLLQARLLESLAWLWISMAAKYGYGREMAFIHHRR